MVSIADTNEYFRRSREWHPLDSEGVARSVAESDHSIVFPPRETDGRVEVFGYHPKLKAWVVAVVIPVGGSKRNILHNGFVEWNHKEEIRERTKQRGRR